MSAPTLSPDTSARLAKMRRDRRAQTAVFMVKAFGLPVATLAYLWWVTR